MDASSLQMVASCDLILFGARGDLVTRKLLPALYFLEQAGLLHADTRIIGVGRESLSNGAEYLSFVHDKLATFVTPALESEVWQRLQSRLVYCAMDLDQREDYHRLKELLCPLVRPAIYYFAIPPTIYASVSQGLAHAGLANAGARVLVEKPIGHDWQSAVGINEQLLTHFTESQIYRVDHFLGKETVLNLLALRFANPLFNMCWDYRAIDHVQITLAEEIGVEGRWNYYDSVGQLRDMVQNHMLQLVALIAMEPPLSLDAAHIREEKRKVLQALRPINCSNVQQLTVRGQYIGGNNHHGSVPGYLAEQGALAESQCETFVALRLDIDNWRWSGVPFYLRTGKRLVKKHSEVVICFKPQPHNIFLSGQQQLMPNRLKIRIQPNEGIELQMMNKQPGLGERLQLKPCHLDLNFDKSFGQHRVIDAYERLLSEAMLGHQSLFVRRDEVELAWEWIDGIMEAWEQEAVCLHPYVAGSWGPSASQDLLARDQRDWENEYGT